MTLLHLCFTFPLCYLGTFESFNFTLQTYNATKNPPQNAIILLLITSPISNKLEKQPTTPVGLWQKIQILPQVNFQLMLTIGLRISSSEKDGDTYWNKLTLLEKV